jgi:hypothetical protein
MPLKTSWTVALAGTEIGHNHAVIPGVLVVTGVRPFSAPDPPPKTTLVVFAAPDADPAEVDLLLAGLEDADDAATFGSTPTETIKLVEGERVLATLDREQLVETRLPQVVRTTVLPEPGTQLGDPAVWVARQGGGVRLISLP